MTRAQRHWFVTTVILLVGCTGESAKDNTGQKGTDGKTKLATSAAATTVVRPELAGAQPDFVLDAKELKKEWSDDSKAAKEKYKGKILAITGFVDTITSDSVVVSASPIRYSNTDVAHCMAPLDKLSRIHRLGNGQKIKVLVKDVSNGIIVDLIAITELEPSNLIERTAEDLAREFEKDPLLAENKYKAKDIAVSGRIKELKKDQLSHRATLVGTNKTAVHVLAVDDFDKWDGKKDVEVRVSFTGYQADRKHVEASGFIMAPK
jgi:hypothetical protein